MVDTEMLQKIGSASVPNQMVSLPLIPLCNQFLTYLSQFSVLWYVKSIKCEYRSWEILLLFYIEGADGLRQQTPGSL
jgi:hypothetical protein